MDYLSEQLKTIINLCLISELLIENDRRDLLPTMLEWMLIETQQLVDDYCVVNE